jgi:hypothetical protein
MKAWKYVDLGHGGWEERRKAKAQAAGGSGFSLAEFEI